MSSIEYPPVTRRLLVTGSRGWERADVLKDVLDQIEQEAVEANTTELIVVHGAAYPPPDPHTGRIPARSADWLAHLWVTLLPHTIRVTEEPHPAPWTKPCDPGGYPACPRGEDHRKPTRGGRGTYCPTAGKRRNQLMVTMGADHAVAFHLDGSRGTQDCIDRIVKAGIELTPIVARTTRASRAAR